MTGPDHAGHPHLEQLEGYVQGTLDAAARARLETHLEVCTVCRNEVRDLARFLTLEEDDELMSEAGWSRAELSGEQGWQQRHQPSWWRQSWVPAVAAAAAAVLLLLVNVPWSLEDLPQVTVRGGGSAPVFDLVEPAGDVPACPSRFAWTFDNRDPVFTLEIFTAELEPVVTVANLDSTAWHTTAALCDSLQPGQRYLWSVQAMMGDEVVARSAAQWFSVHVADAPPPGHY